MHYLPNRAPPGATPQMCTHRHFNILLMQNIEYLSQMFTTIFMPKRNNLSAVARIIKIGALYELQGLVNIYSCNLVT